MICKKKKMNFLLIFFFYIIFERKSMTAVSTCDMKIKEIYCTNDSQMINITQVVGIKERICQCPETVEWRILDKEIGRVEFKIPYVNKKWENKDKIIYQVQLIKNNTSDDYAKVSKDSQFDECDTSYKFKELLWEVDYVENGSYEIRTQYVTRRGSGDDSECHQCRVHLNIRQSSYQMTKINHPNLEMRHDKSTRSSLRIVGTSQHLPHGLTLVLYDRPNGDYHEVNRTSILLNHSVECRCASKDKKKLHVVCDCDNVATGNYRAYMSYVDNRCCHNTAWTKGSIYCSWYKDIEYERVISTPTSTTSTPYDYTLPVSLLVVVTALLLITSLIFVIMTHKRKRNSKIIKWPNMLAHDEEASLDEKPKVLLAYPRDCPLFMETMAQFRKTLKLMTNAEVYDAWDPELWEEVAELKDRWPLKLCNDQNVKLILVASHCSRFIQNALINGDDIQYTEPQAFDNIFLVILSTITQISVTEMPYKRIFVVRLDGDDVEENTLKFINPFTIYTIPQQLNTLGSALQNLDHYGIEQMINAPTLSSLIDELNAFKSDNTNYLDNLIRITLRR